MEFIKVSVRCRPLNEKEIEEGRSSIVRIDKNIGQVSLGTGKYFAFDNVYDESSTQKEIYDEIAFPLVENIFLGFNATIFAYGQTGCGKTWTMIGREGSQRGIIPNSFKQIFESIELRADENKNLSFLVRASFIEIYNEELKDLLNPHLKKKLQLTENEDGINVKNLDFQVVESEEDLLKLLKRGDKNRSVGSTAMNSQSSRSHSIFTIILETSEALDDNQVRYKAAKLNLVDLAGSERQTKTGAMGKTLAEGCKINLSLSSLGNVISALVDNARGKQRFIPYRDSKLTRLLQDSLGGNTKTVMISNIGPTDFNFEETLSTLRYADRAKRIKNVPVVNEDPKDALLRKYQEQIKELQGQLSNQETEFVPSTEYVQELQEKVEIIKDKEKENEEMQLQLEKLKSQIIQLNEKQSRVSNEEIRDERKKRQTKIAKNAELRKEAMQRVEAEENREIATDFESIHPENDTKLRALAALKRRLKKIATKHRRELEEIESEFSSEKEYLLDSIREQNKEIKRLEQTLEMILPEEELFRLWKESIWDSDHDQWDIPHIQANTLLISSSQNVKRSIELQPLTTSFENSAKVQSAAPIVGSKEVSQLMKDLAQVKREGLDMINSDSQIIKSEKISRPQSPELDTPVNSFKDNGTRPPRRLEPL